MRADLPSSMPPAASVIPVNCALMRPHRLVVSEQMAPILNARGIVVSRKALAHYLETGELPELPARAHRNGDAKPPPDTSAPPQTESPV